MKATVNRNFFLSHALLMASYDKVSILATNGFFSVASFGVAGSFRIPAYIIEPGQVCISSKEWKTLICEVSASSDKIVDIVL